MSKEDLIKGLAGAAEEGFGEGLNASRLSHDDTQPYKPVHDFENLDYHAGDVVEAVKMDGAEVEPGGTPWTVLGFDTEKGTVHAMREVMVTDENGKKSTRTEQGEFLAKSLRKKI
jgi:hypothetical protein